jgi:hypothetical protein
MIKGLQEVRDAFQGYFKYIEDFIEDMKKVFPTLGDDWGIYVPEVKYLSPEPLVDYDTLALADFNNVHFVGDALVLEELQYQEHKELMLQSHMLQIVKCLSHTI